MTRGNIKLDNPERFSGEYEISGEKVKSAIKKATEKWLNKTKEFDNNFPGAISNCGKYKLGGNISWTQGLHTGTMLLAYELTGNEEFLGRAKNQMDSYFERMVTKKNLWDHDVGFIYTPSVTALYKLTGDEKLRELGLDAAKHLYDNIYSQKGGFILRSHPNDTTVDACRTMMDTLMNIPLFFWTYEQTGDAKYMEAAKSQLNITEKHLIRPDGSSFHHFEFDEETHAPVRGCTFQGHTDDSTWTRGHSWGVYGFPVAYTYTKDENLWLLHRDVTYFALNHMPENLIPYYDFDFVEKCDEPMDSSAGLVMACGMMEALKYLPDDAEEKKIYKNASAMLLEAVIDNCMDYDKDFDGLVNMVTVSAPHGLGIDGCASYGDFFLLEALLRYTNPDWKRYW